ncbi:MAG: RNA methyltransferase [Caulobacteraceae bacterium]
MIIDVDDPLDSRVAVYREVRERDVAGRRDGFIAEGEVVLRVLARSPLHRADSLLIARERIGRAENLLARFGENTPVYSASRAVMDGLVGFPIHRGMLAFGRRRAPATAEDLILALPRRAIVVVLVGISNHDNIGGIFRNAAALGAHGVLLDATCCDPLYRKAIRVSVGAALTVPFARTAASADALGLLERQGFECLALTPGGETRLAAVRRSDRAAVLLGGEGSGLPLDLLSRARTVFIPMAGGFDSLNVATASGIVLNHLTFDNRRHG